MSSRWLRHAALPIAFTLVAACSTADDDDADSEAPAATEATEGTAARAPTEDTGASGDTAAGGGAGLAGTEVSVFGPESSDEEAGAMQDALDVFAEESGITITYVGARDFEEQVNSQVTGGNPPDIGIFAQPGKVRDFAASGDVFPLPDDVLATARDNWSEDWLALWQDADGTQYGVPNKSDLKSLVWYSPAAFAAGGYEVPETYEDFVTLTGAMIANGDTPLCVGIESGPATGWPFTDWTEELVLRSEGIDYYNGWVAHDTPFNDPPVVAAMAAVNDLWQTEGMVYAPGGSIAATPFGDNAQALVDGNCMMHRQGSFFAAFFPEGTQFGDAEGAIDTFYFPSDEGKPILISGASAAAFRDAPEVWAVMNYFASADYANNRQVAQLARKGAEPGGDEISGYLSASRGADPANFSPLEQGFLEILTTGSPAGFDASDQMPGEVGSGSFWREATALVNGDTDAQAAADAIEASWPT
jgi:alpha-glucoside transport system substrate-binding protein